MPAQATGGEPATYLARLVTLTRSSFAPLLRPTLHPQAGVAAQKWLQQSLVLLAIGVVLVGALMFGFDAYEISLMPPRGAPDLWPVRIVTDFGKAAYVLWSVAALLVAVVLVAPLLAGASRSRLLRFGTELQFIFLAILLSNLAGELIKWIVGRGRPFVGGEANAFHFSHFAGTEAYASFPSAHAVTAAALAFAVSAVWPRAQPAMIVYVLLIIASRLVLLAHHPSDVIAGAVIGLIGAMTVRYWFAARQLGFGIDQDGTVTPPN